MVMKFLPNEAKAFKGTEKNTAEHTLILIFHMKDLLGSLQRFITRWVANFGKNKASDRGGFKIKLKGHIESLAEEGS